MWDLIKANRNIFLENFKRHFFRRFWSHFVNIDVFSFFCQERFHEGVEKPLPPSNSFLITKEKHFGFFPNFFSRKSHEKKFRSFLPLPKKIRAWNLGSSFRESENRFAKLDHLSPDFFPVTGWSSLSWASKWIHNYVETPVEETFAKYAGKYSSLQSYIVHNLWTNRCTAVAQSVERP